MIHTNLDLSDIVVVAYAECCCWLQTIEFYNKGFPFRYDMEAAYFEEGVRSAKRKQMEGKFLQVMVAQGYPCIRSMIELIY